MAKKTCPTWTTENGCTCEPECATANEGTLILAYDTEGEMEPKSIFMFIVIHEAGIHDIKLPLRAAFEDWAKTPEGAEYIEEEGTNWGDATMIPDEFLAKHKIHSYEQAVDLQPGAGSKIDLVFHHQQVVDHNESLVEM